MKQFFLIISSFAITFNLFSQELTLGQAIAAQDPYYDSLKRAYLVRNQESPSDEYYRWKYFWQKRLLPSQKYSDFAKAYNLYISNRNASTNSFSSSSSSYSCINGGNSWQEMGPNYFPAPTTGTAFQRGIGRIDFLTFHPQYNGGTQQTLFCGGQSGLWKSINDGLNWQQLNTDKLDVTACSDVAIDPVNPSIMYLASGQAVSQTIISPFGKYAASNGIYKTTDGGQTWVQKPIFDDVWNSNSHFENYISNIKIHPSNRNVLYMVFYYHSWETCGSQGFWNGRIYKSIDAGQSWSKIYDLPKYQLYDMIFKSDDPNTFYVSGAKLLKFTDTQLNTNILTPVDLTQNLTNWGGLSDNSPCINRNSIRLAIGVTIAAPNSLYVIGDDDSGNFVWVSTNQGSTFNRKITYNMIDPQFQIRRTMMGISVSPTDPNLYYIGGYNVYKTTDGGSTFNPFTSPHTDHRAIKCDPNNQNRLFSCNDSGLLLSEDGGVNWFQRSTGIGSSFIYSISVAKTTNTQMQEEIIAGMQDVTTNIKGANGWYQGGGVTGGDGYTAIIDTSNLNTMYSSDNGPSINRATNGVDFYTLYNLSGEPHSLVFPIVLDPNNNSNLLVGEQNLRIINVNTGAVSLKTIPNTTGEAMTSIAVAPSNSNIIVIGYQSHRLFKTIDGGNNWTEISSSLTPYSANSILIHPTDPNKIWVTFGGYGVNNVSLAVINTIDGGNTWTDYSQGLQWVPGSTIVINPNRSDDDELYMATDAGIYLRNKYMPTGTSPGGWQCFNGLLPNVPVTDIKIDPGSKSIYASTHGRGVWKSPLYCPTDVTLTLPSSPLNFYAATSSIISTSIINNSFPVAYRAPSITLNGGFEVKLGTEFNTGYYSCDALMPRTSGELHHEASTSSKLPDKNSVTNSLKVFPSPTKGELLIEYDLSEISPTNIYIISITGEVLQTIKQPQQQSEGHHQIRTNVTNFQNGLYFIMLETVTYRTVEKFVVQK